jgi:hypothetical protein
MGWNCAERRCPTGDNIDRRHGYGGVNEIQRVVCSANNVTNTSISFTLTVFNQETLPIASSYTAAEVSDVEYSNACSTGLLVPSLRWISIHAVFLPM